MSENPRPSTDRWLVPLGVLLLAEALLFGLPWIEKYRAAEEYNKGVASTLSLYLGQTLFPALLGMMTLVSLRNPAASRAALIFFFAAVLGIELSIFGWIGQSFRGKALWAFLPLSMAVINAASPFLWGSALARIENPGSAVLQQKGRVAAGLIQLGFVFRFVYKLTEGRAFGFSGSSPDPGLAIYFFGDVVESLITLWASIEAVRTVPDEAAVIRRAERIHKLMRAWAVFFVALALLSNAIQVVQSRKMISLAHGLWSSSVFITLQLTAAFVAAHRYRLQFPPSSPPMQRSGDVLSTGETT